ncbi:hypothetical protein JCM9534A_12280 [Catenuloplanes indicus JCM 9534]
MDVAVEAGTAGASELVVSVRVRLGDQGLTPEAERVIQFLRRIAAHDVPDGDDGVLILDPMARLAMRDGRELPLTRLEFELLHFLARHPKRAFSRRELLDHVWPGEQIGGRTVDVHVRRLRLKAGNAPLVSTLRGFGYRLHPAARVTLA